MAQARALQALAESALDLANSIIAQAGLAMEQAESASRSIDRNDDTD